MRPTRSRTPSRQSDHLPLRVIVGADASTSESQRANDANPSERHLNEEIDMAQLDRRTLLKAGLAGAGTALAGGSLAACSGSGGSGSASGGKTTVRLWSWYTEQQDTLPKVLKDF